MLCTNDLIEFIYSVQWGVSTAYLKDYVYSGCAFCILWIMMTSSNGNIFSVTGLLWRIPPVTGGFPPTKARDPGFDVFFDRRQNKRLSKQSRRLWFETPSRSLWCQCNVVAIDYIYIFSLGLLQKHWEKNCNYCRERGIGGIWMKFQIRDIQSSFIGW